jgi:hypothetical protein
MKHRPWWLDFLARIMLIDLLIFAGVMVWAWISADFTTLTLSNHFFLGGAFAILVGIGSSLGNWSLRTDWHLLYAESAGQANLSERTSRMMDDIYRSHSFVITMVSAGLISILVSVIFGQMV